LSAAGEYYKEAGDKLKLTKEKAKFVQVFHTDDKGYGYDGSLGHVDIYINGGSVQPGLTGVDGTLKTILSTGGSYNLYSY